MTTAALAAAGIVGGLALPALADLGGASAPEVRAAAIVNADGSVVRSRGVTGVRKIATGQYCVRMDDDIDASRVVPVASVQWSSTPWDGNVFLRHDNAGCADREVFVGTGVAAGGRDIGFHIIVP
ncbi:hypothetical protein [Actinomadura spongiicola]|uniref:hypothetical protein n=1 Tax=Actinomadura spongiicola TaxID=2303421 RepID=UPI0011C14727|nr:hypothetical protein [Actinomadura spongiicola]